jgi:hypothetical protein
MAALTAGMLLFKKNADPFSERSRELNAKIAELELKIKRLNETIQPDDRPRFRSTAYPKDASITPRSEGDTPRGEPFFEPVDQAQLKSAPDSLATEVHFNDAGAPRYDLASLLDRVRKQFAGPAPVNPKLVNYLAAGNVQGLRPLRYEKRVARNRFLALSVVFVAVLFGVFYFLARRH